MSKQGLSKDVHTALGAELKQQRDSLMASLNILQPAYTKNSAVMRKYINALKANANLRSALDDAACKEFQTDPDVLRWYMGP
jgi:hypothetical protein